MYRFIILLFFGISNNCVAQFSASYNFKFKNYTTLNGMANNVVVKTVKDKNGFLWIATHNGLSRFDGLHFKNYTHNPDDSNSLRSIWVSDLLIDEQQILWVSTEWGLCYHDSKRDKFIYINEKKDIQLLYKMPLCKGEANTIWIAAEDGLKKVNTQTKTFENTALTRIAKPEFIINLGDAKFLIGTSGRGLFQYDSKRNAYSLMHFPVLPDDTYYIDAKIEDGNIWMATDFGLLYYPKQGKAALFNKGIGALKENRIYQLTSVEVFAEAFGKDKLLCGTNDKKLLLFDKTKKVFVYAWQPNSANPNGYSAAIINSLFVNDQILFIGTNEGLYTLNLKNQQSQTYLIPALSNQINEVFVRKALPDKIANEQCVWLIPWKPYYGIILYDKENNKIINEWKTKNNVEAKQYMDIIQTGNGNIIAGRDSAVDIYSIQKGFIKSIAIKSKVLCMLEDENMNLWLGGDNGLTFVNLKNGNAITYLGNFSGTDVEKNDYGGTFPIIGMKQSNANTIWIANGKYGLFSFNIHSKQFTAHRQSFSTAYSTLNRCSSIALNNEDSIWVGNMAGLTCYITKQNKFVNYDMGSGLKSAYIYSLAKDDKGNLWCRGNADITYYNITTKEILSEKLHPETDILNYQQRFYFSDNKIFLGHQGGFSIFNTISIAKTNNIEKPIVNILACKVNNRNFYFNKDSSSKYPIPLHYLQNEISFDFTAVEFNNPEEIEYWYFLEGIDKAWINGGENRSINYNNLAADNYHFQVYALNKRNNTKSKIASFLFLIRPALWQRWWFWPLQGLIFVSLVVYIARKRVAAIRLKEKQKTAVNKAMAELETKMFRSQMNPHFIFNSLNSIQKYIWENKEEDAAEYLARFAKLIRAILENSRKETIPLYEEIEVMKLYIELEHRRSNARFDYSIKTSEDIDLQNIAIPPLLMQPFIENAIWHGLNKKEEKGNLNVIISKKDDQLICVIDDDGVGRQENINSISTEKKSLGIDITQQRIDRLMETTKLFAGVVIEDKKENDVPIGTRVTLTLPLQTITNA